MFYQIPKMDRMDHAQHQDRLGNAMAAQLHSLLCSGYRIPFHVRANGLCHRHGAMAIAVGFDHANHPHPRG